MADAPDTPADERPRLRWLPLALAFVAGALAFGGVLLFTFNPHGGHPGVFWGAIFAVVVLGAVIGRTPGRFLAYVAGLLAVPGVVFASDWAASRIG